MRDGPPKYRIRDNVHNVWLTYDIAWTYTYAMRRVIDACKAHPGRPVILEELE